MDWVPAIATFFLGLSSAIVLQWTKTVFERWQSRKDREVDFQRQTLLDLQVALRDTTNGLDEYLLHQFPQGKRANHSNESEAFRTAAASFQQFRRDVNSVILLFHRIDDESIRTKSIEFLQTMNPIVAEDDSEDVAFSLRTDLTKIHGTINQAIGDRLRAL